MAEPGSFFATQAGHIPVVVTRDGEGVLRGVRQRLPPPRPPGRERDRLPRVAAVPVPRLDVRPRRVAPPRAARRAGAGLRRSALSLLPVAVDTWGPFVFVNPDLEAAPLAETLGDLPALVAQSGVDLDTLRFHSHDEWSIEANWKVALENYLECYHCAVAHPGFSKVIDVDPDAYALSSRRRSRVRSARARLGAERQREGALRARGEVMQSQYHFLWPNTTINIAPGPPNVSIERWVPDGPGARSR